MISVPHFPFGSGVREVGEFMFSMEYWQIGSIWDRCQGREILRRSTQPRARRSRKPPPLRLLDYVDSQASGATFSICRDR